MKLLIYSHYFAPSIGGVETIVQSLARGLAELRDLRGAPEFEVTLVTQTPRGEYDDSVLPFLVIRRPRYFQLLRLIRNSDMLHVAGPAIAPLLFSYLARKPLVIEHHGYQATCPNGLLFHHPSQSTCPGHFMAANYLECFRCNREIEGRSGSLHLLLSAFLRHRCSGMANANIAPSHHVASRQGLPRTEVIFHGVDVPIPSNNSHPESGSAKSPVFAYIGRLVVEKGVSVLIEATRLLVAEGHRVLVLLIGDGPERSRLLKQTVASGIEENVRHLGFLSGAALERQLGPGSIVVIPTIMEETAGLAALEQMTRGRLVIVSRTGGLEGVVGNDGLTFPAGDAHALADSMRTVLLNPGIVESMGHKARERALRLFDRGRMIKEHAHLYFRALEGHQE